MEPGQLLLSEEHPEGAEPIQALIHQAQHGDVSVLPRLRALLDGVPHLWEQPHILARQVERAYLNALSNQDVLAKEILTRDLQALREQLLMSSLTPSPLEVLLVERVCACWLALQHAERITAKHLTPQSCTVSHLEEERLDKVHRRFLTAVRELAKVRQLLQPRQHLQVNIGTNQIVT